MKRNEKILAMIILALLFLYAFNLLIFNPLQAKFAATEQEINRLSAIYKVNSGLEHGKEALLKEYQKIKKYFNSKGSESEKTVAILTGIETEARKAGLLIVDMKLLEQGQGPQSLKNMSAVYTVGLNAEGNIAQIISFLTGLSRADILFDVAKLNLNLKDANTGILRIEANILGVYMS